MRLACLSITILSSLHSINSRRSIRSSRRSTRILPRRQSNSTGQRDYEEIVSIFRSSTSAISRGEETRARQRRVMRCGFDGEGILPCTEASTILLLLYDDLLRRTLLVLHLLLRVITSARLDLCGEICSSAYHVLCLRCSLLKVDKRQIADVNVREVLADSSLVVVVDSHRRRHSCAMLGKPRLDFRGPGLQLDEPLLGVLRSAAVVALV